MVAALAPLPDDVGAGADASVTVEGITVDSFSSSTTSERAVTETEGINTAGTSEETPPDSTGTGILFFLRVIIAQI